jgi:cell division septation protein DedD
MPKKRRGMNRLSAAVVSGFLLIMMACWPGCDRIKPEPEAGPPTPYKLGDITLRGSGTLLVFTATAVVSPGSDLVHTPSSDKTGPDETGAVPATPVPKQEPKKPAKKPAGETPGPPQRGEFTIQIGAYIVDKNLANTKEELISLGFSPYIKDTKRKMKMFCVIIGEPMTEEEAREIVSALSEKGFAPRLLPNKSNMVDVAGGIYYYKDDASAAQGMIKAFGYAARVEERTVEVILKCLRIGGYATVDEAGKDRASLERKGFSPVILKSDQ